MICSQMYPPKQQGEWTDLIDVSVLTVLLPFYKLAPEIDVMCITVINEGAVPASVILELSEDAQHVDELLGPGQNGGPLVFPVNPGKQCSTEIGPNRMRRYFRISAQTADPAFPTTQLKFRVTAIHRA